MSRNPSTSRRAVLKGLAGLTVLAAGGVVYRAWDNGAFDVGKGPAYQLWHDWREGMHEGPLAIVQAGILASNAHNTQPWRFNVSDDRIELYADHHRHLGSFDPYRREMALSLGCALENMVLTARARGFAPVVELANDRFDLGGPNRPEHAVASLRLATSEPQASELYRMIAHRHTHRGSYRADAIPLPLQQEIQSLVDERDVRVFLFDHGSTKVELGELIVSATEDIVADHEMAMDSAKWFRFDWRSVQQHRDGVTLDAVGLPPLLNTVAKIAPSPSAEEADQQWLDATRRVHVGTAPLFGLIAVNDLYDQATTLRAGRLWQRLHLWATARGVAAQPLNMPPERVDREAELGREPRMAAALARVTGDAAWRPTFVFRMGYADRSARLSPRRPVQAVVSA
jgi:hypothetical protein